MLNFDTFVQVEARSVDRMNNQRISYGAEDKHSLVQQSCISTAIAFNMENIGLIHLVLVGYGRLAGR